MKLYVDRNKIDELIKQYNNENSDIVMIDYGQTKVINKYSYKFAKNGKEACVDIYFNKHGYTTLEPSRKYIEEETKFIDYIKASNICYCSIDKMPTVNIALNISKDNQQILVEYLQEKSSVCTDLDKNIKFTSRYGETIVLSKYESKILLQGKAGYLFSMLMCFVLENDWVDFETANNVYLKTFNVVQIQPMDEYKKQITNIMPKAYSILNEHLKTILYPSVILITSGPDLPEYSAYLFPVYRTLEGFIKQLLKDVSYSDKYFSCFKTDKNTGVVSFDYNCDKNHSLNKNQVLALIDLYKYLTNKRNPIFHIEKTLEMSKIIEDKNVAKSHIEDTMKIMESAYIKYIS